MISIELEILAVTVGYSLLLVAFQRLLIDVDKMYELRAHINKHQKNLMEMAKNNASKEEMAEKQKLLIAATTESFKMQIKVMVVTLPIYAILYYFVLPKYFSAAPNLQILSLSLSYRWSFIIFSIILTFTLQTLISFYDRKRLKDKYNFGLMQNTFKDEQQA